MSSDEDEDRDTSLLSSASSISDCIEIKTMQEHIVAVIETKKENKERRDEAAASAGGMEEAAPVCNCPLLTIVDFQPYPQNLEMFELELKP